MSYNNSVIILRDRKLVSGAYEPHAFGVFMKRELILAGELGVDLATQGTGRRAQSRADLA